MADEFRHKDAVAGKIYENEYENINQHILNDQAQDDLVYASSATQLSRLPMAASRIVAKLAAGGLVAATVAQIKTLLGVGDASGIASLDATTKVVEQPAAHKASHKWLGSDEVEIHDTFFTKMPFLVLDSDFAEATKWTQFVENTGSFTQKLAFSEMKSGATINSEVGVYSASMWVDAAAAASKLRLMARIQTTHTTDIKWAFGFFEHNPDTTDPVTQVTNKDKCIAFYAEDNKLYAVVGDGTNLTKTEIDTLAGGHLFDLYLRGRAADAIDFYVSDNGAAYTLETLATYNPAAGMLYLVVWMENFAAAAKQINLYHSIKLNFGSAF